MLAFVIINKGSCCRSAYKDANQMGTRLGGEKHYDVDKARFMLFCSFLFCFVCCLLTKEEE